MSNIPVSGVFNFALIALVLFIHPALAQSKSEEKIKNIAEIRDDRTKVLEEEIKTVNLLNNLNLSKEQLEYIILQAKEIGATRKKVYSEFNRYSGRMFGLEERVKRQVESGRVFLDKPVADEYRRMKKECDLLFYRLNNRVKEGIRSVEAKLENFQLVALDKYIPCIIPIVSDSFIGGADKSVSWGRFLERSRAIPAERYEVERDRHISARITEVKDSLSPCKKLCPDDIAREEIDRAINQARDMDEVDFKLKVNMLADELCQKIILEEPEISCQDKIQRFLLSESNIPVLEKRLKRNDPQGGNCIDKIRQCLLSASSFTVRGKRENNK